MTSIKGRKKTLLFNLTDACIVVFIGASLFFPMPMARAAKETGELVLLSVLPALFPFLVLGQLLILSGLGERIGNIFGFLMPPLFALPKSAFSILLLGLFAGFPVGAVMTERLYVQGGLTKEQAERLLAFSNNASFAFVVGVVGGTLLGNVAYGLLLYIAALAASLWVGMLLSLFAKGKPLTRAKKAVSRPRANTAEILVQSVASSAKTCLEIMGFVVFFGVVLELLRQVDFFAFLRLFGESYAEKALPLAYGFFDMTNGIFGVAQSGQPLSYQLPVMGFLLGFSSLSVLFQIISVVLPHDFSLKPLFFGKALQGILTLFFVGMFQKLPIFARATFLGEYYVPAVGIAPQSALILLMGTTGICVLLWIAFRLTFVKK